MPSLEYPKTSAGNVVYSCTGDGEVSLVSSDENLIEVGEITNTNIKITALKNGTGTITLKQAEGANYKKSNEVTKDISIGLSSYTANVVVQNGTVDTASKSIKYGANTTFTISSSTGYESPTVSCTNSQSASISGSTLTVSNITKDTTCTVTYSANTYNITLTNTSATTSGTTSVKATYNSSSISPSTITLPKRSYTVSGFGTSDSRNSTGATISSTSTLTSTYTFNGWYTGASEGSKVISNSTSPAYVASVSGYTDANSKWVKAGTATLYAQWTSSTVKLPTITKTGYTCGWTTSSSGTTISYASGATYTPTENKTMYAVCEANSYTVNVVVQNGTVDTASKNIKYQQSGTFNLTPEISGTTATVTCTNDQTGTISNNTLTVSNVTNNTTCTVKYITEMTTLYTDGTLIINENLANRSSNITTHGAVTNEYEAMSNSNSYVFSSDTSMPWNSEKTSVTSMKIGSIIQPVSTKYWAYGLTEMATGDFTNLDTSQVTDMSYMFYEAGYYASTFDLTLPEIHENLTLKNMSFMFAFAGFSSRSFSISGIWFWTALSVENMSYMFFEAGREVIEGWSIGDISSWYTSSVTDMSYMFSGAGYMAEYFEIGDLSIWDTSSVTNMEEMFSHAGETPVGL